MSMRPLSSHESICRGIRVAGTPGIAAPGTSYAVDFSRLLEKAELLPPAAADSPTGKIDEYREEESAVMSCRVYPQGVSFSELSPVVSDPQGVYRFTARRIED